MGDDDYHPISMKGSNLTSTGGMGYFIVDSLDTMKLMGLEGEYMRARKWVDDELSFDRDGKFSTFEVYIPSHLNIYFQLTFIFLDDDTCPGRFASHSPLDG